ncbi:MAG TPA: hypothetical protein VGX68_29165 [Thermoanaerobaculia bacterium]|nr:hypothetical protein [Thermoanaerobaculia bacterium]
MPLAKWWSESEMPKENRAMAAPPSSEITIPNVRLGLEELLAVIHDLDEPSRTRVAQVLAETEMDARFKDLIAELAARAPAAEISDAEIDREVQMVREASRSA